jgi:DNA-binding NtrC family response regulator
MKPKILVIDDDTGITSLLEAILDDDYAVTSCNHLNDGLAAVINENFDLILTDYHNPTLRGGLEMVKAVRKHCEGTPVIVMTSDPLERVRLEVETICRADGYYQKAAPDIIVKLPALIKRCLKAATHPKTA